MSLVKEGKPTLCWVNSRYYLTRSAPSTTMHRQRYVLASVFFHRLPFWRWTGHVPKSGIDSRRVIRTNISLSHRVDFSNLGWKQILFSRTNPQWIWSRCWSCYQQATYSVPAGSTKWAISSFAHKQRSILEGQRLHDQVNFDRWKRIGYLCWCDE